MKCITGLLIDPTERTATTVRFDPRRIYPGSMLQTNFVRRFLSPCERLQYLVTERPAREEDEIVYHPDWSAPVPGRVLITATPSSGHGYASLRPQQVSGCRRSHRIGMLFCAGIIFWEELRRAPRPITLTGQLELLPNAGTGQPLNA